MRQAEENDVHPFGCVCRREPFELEIALPFQIGVNGGERLADEVEHDAQGDLPEGIAYCENARDFVPRDLLLKILDTEEEHIDFLDPQFDIIK